MGFTISQFQNQFHGGARPNLFEAKITGAGALSGDLVALNDGFEFLCTTGEIPGSTLGTIPISYMGRLVNYVGNRTYAGAITTTILNDEDFKVRLAVERWHAHISNADRIERTAASNIRGEVTRNLEITQWNRAGNTELRNIKFYRCIPVDIGAIPLSWDQNDTFETFDITWQYDYWASETVGETSDNSVVNPSNESPGLSISGSRV